MAPQDVKLLQGDIDNLAAQIASQVGAELRGVFAGGGGASGRTPSPPTSTSPSPGSASSRSVTPQQTAAFTAEQTLLTRIANASFDTVENAIKSYDDLVKISTLRNANALENILDRYGGNFTKAYITRNKELDSLGEGLARSQIMLFNESTRMFRDTDLGNYYRRIEDMQRDMFFMQDTLSSKTYNAAVGMSEATMEQALRFKETMGFTGTEVSTLLRRGYIESGETSEEILNNIAFHASEISEATGIPMKHLSHGIKDVMSDMATFTKMTESSAGRLTASLMEMGVSITGFEGMLTPFRDFSTAATKMGDISSIFGVQLDAMEMMYLANEDEEKFLHRMREDLISQGVDMENMSGARQRVLSRTLGMSMEETRTFLSTGERLTSMSDLQAASQKATARDQATAFQLLKDQKMPQVFDAATQKLRQMDVEVANNARSILQMKNNLAGVNTELGKLYNTKTGKALSEANKQVLEFIGDAPEKMASILAQNFKIEPPDTAQVEQNIKDAVAKIKPGLGETVVDLRELGNEGGVSFATGVVDGATGDGAPLSAQSPLLFYIEKIRPGLKLTADDMYIMGQLGGKEYARGLSETIETTAINVGNPFASIPLLAETAGTQSVNNFMSALSVLSTEELDEVLGTSLVNKLKMDFEANASISVDEIAQNLSRSVLDYEKKRHDELRQDIKSAISSGFSALGSVSYSGDISLKIDGKEMLSSLSDKAKVKLTSIAIATTADGRKIMTTNTG